MYARDLLPTLLLTAALGGSTFAEGAISHLRSVRESNLCRCEAEWEDFYGRRRDLQNIDEAGFHIVDGIKVIPCDEGASEFLADPSSVRLDANIFNDWNSGRHLKSKKAKAKSSARTMGKASRSGSSKSGSSKSGSSKEDGHKMDTVYSSKGATGGMDKSSSSKSSAKMSSRKRGDAADAMGSSKSGRTKGNEGKLPPVFDCSVDFPKKPTDEPGSGEYTRGPVRDHFIAYAVPQLRLEPNATETAQLLEVTKQFWQSYFETYYADKDVLFEGLELSIDEKLYNAGTPEPQFNYYLDFDAVLLYDSNSASPPNTTETFAIMTQADFADYILNYVRNIPAFASTNEISFQAIDVRDSARTRPSENTSSSKDNVEVDAKGIIPSSEGGKVSVAFLSAVTGVVSLLL